MQSVFTLAGQPRNVILNPTSCVALLPVLLLMVACGSSASPAAGGQAPAGVPSSGLLKVVSTVSPITSIVENIGGTRIELEGIVPEGVNSHTFAPAPSVAKVISQADLIVLNGLLLEEPTLSMARANKKPQAIILSLGDEALAQEDWQFDFSFPQAQGRPNPHLWPDPLLALRYAELVRDQLAALDASNADYYTANLEEFRQRIHALDAAVKNAVATIPPANRKLLTYHDSWAYFARRYSLEVVGAVQPSSFTHPSVQEVAQLIKQVRELDLPAVFGSKVFPSDVLETIAGEAEARFIDELADDDLPGVPGEPRHSYLGMMLQNMEIMIPALGGDAGALSQVDPNLVFEGESRAVYPQ